MGYNELLFKVRKEALMSAYVILVRLCLAILFAGVIGYDRQRKNRPAGLRTHILVCIGATAISMIQAAVFYQKMHGFPEIEVDQVRLLAPIVSGIGFLGAGTIVVTKQRVAGLTTAASLWTTAALGIALGMGYYEIAGLTFLGVIFSLTVIRFIVRIPDVRRLEIHYVHRVATKEFFADFFKTHHIELTDVQFDVTNVDGKKIYRNTFTIHLPKDLTHVQLIEELSTNPDIMKVRLVSINE